MLIQKVEKKNKKVGEKKIVFDTNIKKIPFFL